jgi:hypothetical protein
MFKGTPAKPLSVWIFIIHSAGLAKLAVSFEEEFEIHKAEADE